MSDPVTVGAIASTVLSLASEAALKGAVGEAVKDAYKALKEKISHWAAGDVEALERNPSSVPRRAVLSEVIDQLPENDQISVRALATELANALKKRAAEGPIGIDIGRLEAARVQLGTINVHEGVGFRVEELRTPGDFEMRELNVGEPPGKSSGAASDPASAATTIGALFQGAAEIGGDAIIGTKLAIQGGLHLYSSLPEAQQTFTRKCLTYRDVRVGNPATNDKNRLGEIFFGKTPAKLPLSSFTSIHIFAANCFEQSAACDLSRLWNDENLLAELNAWEPPANWRGVWRLEKRFNSQGLLLFHDKIDYCHQYIQFSERGIIEAVDHGLHGWSLHTRTIPGIHWENGILSILQGLLKALMLIGGETPATICLSIRDDLDYMTVSYEADAINQSRDKALGRHRMGIKEGLLTLPPAVVTDYQEDLQFLMKPCFDAFAKAGGLPGSPRYAK